MQINRFLVLTGALLLMLGSRLPWMSVPILFGVQGPAYESIEIGWEDNGLITGGIGLILLVGGIFLKATTRPGYSTGGAILAAYAIFVVIGCFQRILEIDPRAGSFAATDIGIYVTLLGSLLAFAGALGAGIMSSRHIHRHTPDAGDSAQISSSFLRLSIFLVGRLRCSRPSAGNASR